MNTPQSGSPQVAARPSIPALRITAVRAAPLFGESPKGGWSAEIRPQDSIHALIAVHTDGGITGHGSVFTDGRLVQAALPVLEPLFLGADALAPERLSEKLHQNTFWMGRGGTLTHTISGIDIALWDILGKAAGMPVWRLIGGARRREIPAYASDLSQPTLEATIARAQRHKANGYRAMKFGWGGFGRDRRRDVALVRAAREGAGDDVALMIDVGLCWDLPTALERVAALVPAFEERLAREVAKLEHVGDVRQHGLMIGIELVRDRERRVSCESAERVGHRVCLAARRHGVIIRPLGDVVVLMPPLSLERSELDLLVDAAVAGIREVTES